MSHQLKIKYCSIALEATLIHKEELRCKRYSRRHGRKAGKLRWSAERRAARQADGLHKDYTGQAVWTAENLATFGSLNRHRYELKEELRSTHLARAFLRGLSYRAIERTNNPLKSGPNLNRISRLVAKYGDPVKLGLDPKWDRDEREEHVLELFIKPWIDADTVAEESAQAA